MLGTEDLGTYFGEVILKKPLLLLDGILSFQQLY
jgi:hypothetical protein